MENASVVNADVEWRDEYGIDTEDWIIESIPRYKYLKLKYETADGVRIKLFMLELEACLYAEPQMGLGNEGEDHELYEDPDVVREAFERQARLQHIANGDESSSSGGSSFVVSVDSDWSLKYGGR
uniref:Uncharacterized protein n=1 Tax=Oryza rufipogon TaxID=4529 RepID=A0A0E0MWL3_ORYRU